MSGGDGRRPPTGRWMPTGAPEPRRGGAWRCGLITVGTAEPDSSKPKPAGAGPVFKVPFVIVFRGKTQPRPRKEEKGPRALEGSHRGGSHGRGEGPRTSRVSSSGRGHPPGRPLFKPDPGDSRGTFNHYGRGRRRLVEGVRRRRRRRSRRVRRRVRASGPTRPRRRRRRALPGVRRTRVRRRAPPEAQGSPREPRRREHLAHALHGCREGGQRRGRRERVVVGRRGRAEGRRGARGRGGRAKETSRAARGSHAPIRSRPRLRRGARAGPPALRRRRRGDRHRGAAR